jgi:uncharacterized membrane protein YkvA (DUF1232 family)
MMSASEWLSVRTSVARAAFQKRQSDAARVCVRQLALVRREIHALALVARHACTPWYAKLIATLAVGYTFSPVQIIPSVIPVLGLLDDVVILSAGMRLALWLTPPAILAECRERAEGQREGEAGTMGRRTMFVVGAVWLVMATLGAGVGLALIMHFR